MNISDLLKDPNKVKEVLTMAIDNKNKELAEMLIPIVKHPYLTYLYAEEIVKDKIKDEWEDIIAQDPDSIYAYAYTVLHKPFIKGEDAIINSEWLEPYVEFLKSINKLDEFLKDHPEVKI